MRDRFGPLPAPVRGLLEVVRVRRRCQQVGVERLVARGGKMVLYFIGDPRSPYYASPVFKALLQFVQRQSVACRLNERDAKLTLSFAGVDDMERVSAIVREIHENTTSS
jgi:transcription-repair coupling factor (superfamily II helicase)